MPLLTNPFLLWDMARILAVCGAVMWAMVLAMSFFFTDEVVLLPPQVLLMALAILAALFAFVALVVFRNAMHMRFVVDSHGVRVESIYGDDAYEHSVSALMRAVLFLVNPLVGLTTSLSAAASGGDGLSWSDVRRVTVHRRLGVISLADSWHTVMRLYCDPRSVDMLADRVQHNAGPVLARQARQVAQQSARRPLVFYLVWTAVALAATAASLAWYWAAEDMERPAVAAGGLVLLLGWAIPAWWSRLVAWPAVAASLLLTARLIPPALEQDTVSAWHTVYGYQMDTPELALAALGCLTLVAMSLSVLVMRPERVARKRAPGRRADGDDTQEGRSQP